MRGQQQPGKRDPRSCCDESVEQRPPLASWNADSASWWRQPRDWCCRRRQGTQVLCRWDTGRRRTAAWTWSTPELEASGVHGEVASRDRTSGHWIRSEQWRGGLTAADKVGEQVVLRASRDHASCRRHCHQCMCWVCDAMKNCSIILMLVKFLSVCCCDDDFVK